MTTIKLNDDVGFQVENELKAAVRRMEASRIDCFDGSAAAWENLRHYIQTDKQDQFYIDFIKSIRAFSQYPKG